MRTASFLISCSCILLHASSQWVSTNVNKSNNRYAISLAPVLFPFDRVGLQTGFQFRIKDSWAVLTEVGVPVSKASEKADNYQQTAMLKLQSELKYYPANRDPDRFYSVQIGYMKRTFTDPDSGTYRYPGAGNVIGYSRLTVKSPVYFFALKWGSEAVEWKKVFLDCFFGLGIRVIPTSYDPVGLYSAGQPRIPIDNLAWMAPTPAWEYNKTCIRPHLTIGFRVGGKF